METSKEGRKTLFQPEAEKKTKKRKKKKKKKKKKEKTKPNTQTHQKDATLLHSGAQADCHF